MKILLNGNKRSSLYSELPSEDIEQTQVLEREKVNFSKDPGRTGYPYCGALVKKGWLLCPECKGSLR